MRKLLCGLLCVLSLSSAALAAPVSHEYDGWGLRLAGAMAACPNQVSEAMRGADGFGRATAVLNDERGDKYYNHYELTSYKYHGITTTPPTPVAILRITEEYTRPQMADVPATRRVQCQLTRIVR